MENNYQYQKHLITCRCILPQYKKIGKLHRFIVFSIIENDNVIEKFARCNNCNVVHRVYDICKSEIINTDEFKGIITIDDIKLSLPKNLIEILDKHNCDVATWENTKFIFENKMWGNFVTLTNESSDGYNVGKYIIILGENFFKIESFSNREYI